jgi:hypothetical protein
MATEALHEALARIEADIDALEAKRREIYQRSLTAPEEEKVAPDFVSSMEAAESSWPKMKWPKVVTGIHWGDGPAFRAPREGLTEWVAVRPCAEEFGGKTYLGVMIGDIALSISARYDAEGGVLSLSPVMHNPAIWIPDLRRVVFGCGSWWWRLKSPDDLRTITDADIENVWYVRALRDLTADHVSKGGA